MKALKRIYIKPTQIDLNKFIEEHTEHPRTNCKSGNIEVYFNNIKNNLISKIMQYDTIVGCVAWLSDFDLLDALATRKNVCIIIQKEDFLRPDYGFTNKEDFRKTTKEKYSKLKNSFYRTQNNFYPLNEMSYCSQCEIESIRVCGVSNQEHTRPIMHHKFMVFCNLEEDEDAFGQTIYPQTVWTGSFNMTYNANRSLENGLFINDKTIANEYFEEFCFIASISEPINWHHEYVDPQWYPGS